MFSIGQVIELQQFHNSPIITRTIISVDGERIFYRKENGNVGQCSAKLLENVIRTHGANRPKAIETTEST
jgi:hypothetical protein